MMQTMLKRVYIVEHYDGAVTGILRKGLLYILQGLVNLVLREVVLYFQYHFAYV